MNLPFLSLCEPVNFTRVTIEREKPTRLNLPFGNDAHRFFVPLCVLSLYPAEEDADDEKARHDCSGGRISEPNMVWYKSEGRRK